MADRASDTDTQRDQFARQMAAELAATRTILQCLLVSMFGNHPDGTALVDGLRDNALANLSHASAAASSSEEIAHFHHATRQLVNRFFEDMRPVFPHMQAGSKQN